MSVRYIASITDRYARLGYPAYRWYEADGPPPWQPLARPLSSSRLSVVTTSGAYVAGQVAFYYKDDTSVRAIPRGTPPERMRFSHITENYLVAAREDPDALVPIRALATLEAEGRIGEVADELLSCMGGIYSQRRTREELAPDLHDRLVAQGVDAVLLVPM